MANLRILHTTSSMSLDMGGPARSIRGLCNESLKLGHTVGLHISEEKSLTDVTDLIKSGVEVLTGDLAKLAREWKSSDIVHDHGIWLPSNHRSSQFCITNGLCRIVSPRGMLEPWAMRHKRWKKWIAWNIYQRRDLTLASALHATAESEANQFRKLGLSNPIKIVPNGVEIPSIPQDMPNKEKTESVRTALFLSRIHPKKGLPILAQSWAATKPVGWRMRVIGPDEGGHKSEVKALTEELGISDQWQFEDALEGCEKWAALASADIFILPTYSENFGISIAEALISGLPVITTTGTPWSRLTTEGCGWWVNPNKESLSSILAQALTLDSNILVTMGEKGRNWMKREFLWDSIGSKMEAFYLDSISSRI